ncbi:hypothetical protein FRC06_000995, partial [Ceratobasidium sp. 370]
MFVAGRFAPQHIDVRPEGWRIDHEVTPSAADQLDYDSYPESTTLRGVYIIRDARRRVYRKPQSRTEELRRQFADRYKTWRTIERAAQDEFSGIQTSTVSPYIGEAS